MAFIQHVGEFDSDDMAIDGGDCEAESPLVS